MRSSVMALGLLMTLAVGAVHSGSVTPHFVFDDHASIVKNGSIRSLWSIDEVLSPPARFGGTEEARPLLNLSFAISRAIHGMSARGFHIDNVVIHVVNVLLLFALLAELLPRTPLRDGANSLAFLLALLWGLHPVTTAAVSYVAQRAEALGALFYLATLLATVRAIRTSQLAWSLAAAGLAMLGVMAKETVVTAPLAALLIDRAFFAASWREIGQRRRGLYAGMFASWIVVFALAAAYGARSRTAGTGAGISSWDYLRTQAVALVWYVRQIAWPFGLIFDYGARLVTDWRRVAPAGGAVLLTLGGLGLLWSRRPQAATPFLLFFLILAPTSTVLPIVTQTMGEHRLYLPAACVLTGAAAALLAAAQSPAARRFALGAILLGVVAAGGGSVLRNRDYASPLALWTSTWERCPENPRGARSVVLERVAVQGPGSVDDSEVERLFERSLADANSWNRGMAWNERGQTWQALGRLDRAASDFETLIAERPELPEGHNNLGFVEMARGRPREAVARFDAALKREPRYALALVNRGNARRRLGEVDLALADFDSSIRILPSNGDAYFSRGSTFLDRRDWRRASADFREAVRLTPENDDALRWLAFSLQESGSPAEALAVLQERLRGRDGVDLHLQAATVCDRLKRPSEARSHLERAVRTAPDGDWRAHLLLARRLLAQHETDEAERLLRQVREDGPARAEVHFLLGMAAYLKGDLARARMEWDAARGLNPEDPAVLQALEHLR